MCFGPINNDDANITIIIIIIIIIIIYLFIYGTLGFARQGSFLWNNQIL